MARSVSRWLRAFLAWLRALPRAAYRLVQDTFCARLVVSAIMLWRRSRFLSTMLAFLLLGCLLLAGSTARLVFDSVRTSASGVFWPGVAAVFAFLVMLELSAASLMAALRGLLRLSLDIGRHRIGVLLTMATIVLVCVAARGVLAGSGTSAALLVIVSAMLAGAFWFERAYRRPAYPGFRDFHADVVGARHAISRAAHGG